MSHIVESCPLTKLNGDLSRLHSADEDAVSWLTRCGSWNAYEKKKNTVDHSTLMDVLTRRSGIHDCALGWIQNCFSGCSQVVHALRSESGDMTLQYGFTGISAWFQNIHRTCWGCFWHVRLSWAATSSVCRRYARLLQWTLGRHSCDDFRNWMMCFRR